MPHSLRASIDDYDEVMLRRTAPETRRSKWQRLNLWYGWVSQETHPRVSLEDICEPDERYMERYFNKLRPPRYEAGTFNQYRQILTGFWKYTIDRGWVRTNPMLHVRPLKVPRKVQLRLSESELVGLLDDASPRDRIALAIGMNIALRGKDISALTVGQVDLTSNQMYVWVEKTDTEEIFPISLELRVELLRWLSEYARVMDTSPSRIPNDWTLVPPLKSTYSGLATRRVTYMTHKHLSEPHLIARRALEARGYDNPRLGFHVLRRSSARAIYEIAKREGIPDPAAMAQALLRHKQRRTTELYLDITHEKELLNDMLRGQSFLGRSAGNLREARVA